MVFVFRTDVTTNPLVIDKTPSTAYDSERCWDTNRKLSTRQDGLEAKTLAPQQERKKIGTLALAALVYFSVSGGPFGMEEVRRRCESMYALMAAHPVCLMLLVARCCRLSAPRGRWCVWWGWAACPSSGPYQRPSSQQSSHPPSQRVSTSKAHAHTRRSCRPSCEAWKGAVCD